MMCEREGFISHMIKGGKHCSPPSRGETYPLSHVNSQHPSYRTDETPQRSTELPTPNQNSKPPKSSQQHHQQQLQLQQLQLQQQQQHQQQQISPSDEEIDCLLQKTGFLEEKGWSKFLGGNFMKASVTSFTVMCCLLAMINGALVAGYVSSVITTIEKRFDIGSFYSGMVAASVEMGGASSVIFVSYFGSSRHIPGWIGLGAVLTGFGALVFTLPHVMAPAYTVTGGLNASVATDSICRPKPLLEPLQSSLVSGIFSMVVDSPPLPCTSAKFVSPLFYVLILIVAQLLIGIGGSPLYTLGTTYIDNHVSRMKAPSYIAFIYACGVFGPITGFGLGALMLQYYVDLLTFDTTALNLTPSNPKWVGAWWGGFVFIGALLLLVSVPFYGFPKILVNELRMLAKQDRQKFFSLMEVFGSSQSPQPQTSVEPSSSDKTNSMDKDGSSYGKNIRDIPAALLKIFKNPIYLVTSLGICCEVSVVSGFVFFLPKYLESEFGATKTMASLLTGGIAIPGAVIGILMGGHCLRHCQLTSKGAIQLTLALNSIALAGFGLFFVLGCDNVKIAGITVPYDNHSQYHSLNSYVSVNRFNLTSSCNRHCNCDNNNLDLVCGADEVMFFSPCHAGCMEVGSLNPVEQNYTNCACARLHEPTESVAEESPKKSLWVRSASGGSCQHVCGTLIPFMVMLFIMTFVIAGTQMPLLMVTIRSVGEQEKALALGLQFVMLRLFAYIPAPIIYGWQIDHTCIFWTKSCGSLGNCLVYDLVQLRYKFVGISFAYKFFAAMFYLSIWIIMWLRHDKTLKDSDAGKRMSLIIVEESNVLCTTTTINFQSSTPDVEASNGGDSFKMSYESVEGYSGAGSEDCILKSEDDFKQRTSDRGDVAKQFDSFPLIDDDNFDVARKDNERAAMLLLLESTGFEDKFHKFPTLPESTADQERVEL